MKKSILIIIFFFSSVLTTFSIQSLTSTEVKNLLTNNTFLVQYHKGSKAGQAYHVFFDASGQVTSQRQPVYPVKITKTGSWQVKAGNLLCVSFKRRKKNYDVRTETCGIMVAAEKNKYKHYDEEVELHSTFTYIGSGNLLK